MRTLGFVLLAIPVAFFVYSYFLYPALLLLAAGRRPRLAPPPEPAVWPSVSITIPAYNEAATIARTIENLLAVEYPVDRRQILIVSDASSDGTDAVVARYKDRGVELLSMPVRGGKTAAENAARPLLRGEIIVNTDAKMRIMPGSLKPLVRWFGDPTVGVASGRDASIGAEASEANLGETGYVGYEMWVRALETRVGSIVGASGSYYAIRRHLHETLVPEALSRDFASALICHENGMRAVSVDDAVCLVPRTTSLRTEFRRKVRTMARGLDTLWYKRALMNPFRHGGFALMLISHKLCRWLVNLTAPLGAIGLVLLALSWPPAWWLVALGALGLGAGVAAILWPEKRAMPKLLAVPGYGTVALIAGLLAWRKAIARERSPIWEPTHRPV